MKISLFLSLMLFGYQSLAFDIIAHRGLPRLHPEHTLTSLNEALKLKPTYVEPDVVLTKDLVPVVLHDTHIDTTTDVAKKFPGKKRKDGRFYAADLTFEELKTLTANHRIDLKTGKSAFATRPVLKDSKEKVPSLDEFLATVKKFNESNKTKIGIYPEIKHPEFHQKQGMDIVKIVHDRILKFSKNNPDIPVIVQCFDFNAVKRMAKDFKTPLFLVQLVAENSWGESSTDYDYIKSEKGLKEVKKYAKGLGPWIPQLISKEGSASDFLKNAKSIGFKIHPYTLRNDSLYPGIKDEKQLLDLLKNKLKVDGVFTDNVNTSIPLLKTL